MSDKKDYEVKVVSAPKINDQFGKRGHISIKQPPMRTLVIIGISAVTFLPFLTNTRSYHTKKVLGLKTPAHIKPITINIPTYSLTDELTSDTQRKIPRKRQVIHYSGASVVSRPLTERVLPGSMLKAELVSGASTGLIKARATESLRVLGNEVIPTGSIFIGTGSPTKHRLQIRFNKVVLPDGTIQDIAAIGADISDKISGLKGSKVGHYGLKLAASAGLHFVAGLSQGMRERDVQNGVPVERTDTRNAVLNGVSLASLELANETMSEIKSQKPTYNIPFGTRLYILFSGK